MSDTATETINDRINPAATVSVHTNSQFYLPLVVRATLASDRHVFVDIGPVAFHLDDVDALVDLHRRIGREVEYMQRAAAESAIAAAEKAS